MAGLASIEAAITAYLTYSKLAGNEVVCPSNGCDAVSNKAEIALAKHLTQIGAIFYGAFWFAHCHKQKQLFGKEAFQYINYVECSMPDSRGQTSECQQQQIQAYPTWEIKGTKFPSAMKSPEELAQLSGYQGANNF